MVAEIDGAGKGCEISAFLKTFEGAAATFDQDHDSWSLWLPEMCMGDRPITPASQLYFAVILRHEDEAFAIRFFYDCSTGKIRYYTSAVPQEVALAPEFENAVSELFRHTLPVEPIRQRKLRASGRRRRERIDSASDQARRQLREVPARMADPAESSQVGGRSSEPKSDAEEPSGTLDAFAPGAKEDERLGNEAKVGENDGVTSPSGTVDSSVRVDKGQGSPPVVKRIAVIAALHETPNLRSVVASERSQKSDCSTLELTPKAGGFASQSTQPAAPAGASDAGKSANSVWSTVDSKSLTVAKPTAPQMNELATGLGAEISVTRPTELSRSANDFDGVRKVEFDVGARMRSVLMSVIYACGIVATIGILAYSYLVLTEDPGVKHHRLQNEALQSQASR